MKLSIKNTIINILSGRMTKKEENEILRRESVMSAMQQQWNDPAGDLSGFNKQGVWDQLEQKIHGRQAVPVKGPVRRWFAWPAAACIVLLLGIGYYYYLDVPADPAASPVVVETGYQERTMVILPDSTKVWLNAGSRIEYPEAFTGGMRSVRLHGEAYFDVTPDSRQVFVVSTGHLQIHVLGTRFSVSDYEDENTVETVLVSGKVRVDIDESGEQFDLLPDEHLLFDTEQQTVSVQRVDAAEYTGWISGKLVFDDADLGEVVQRLERWYGVVIRYPEGSGDDYRLTFTVRDETLEQIMWLMQNMTPVKFELSGNDKERDREK